MRRTEPAIYDMLWGRKKRRNEGGKEEMQFLENVRATSRWPPCSPQSVVCIYLQAGHRSFQKGPRQCLLPPHCPHSVTPPPVGSSPLFLSVWGNKRTIFSVARTSLFSPMTQKPSPCWIVTWNQTPRPDHCPSQAQALPCSPAIVDLAPQAACFTQPMGEVTGAQERDWS